MNREASPPRYKYDLGVRFGVSVIAAYIASQYGGDEGFLELILTPVFYIEYSITLLITLLVVHVIFLATRFLDKRFDWHERPYSRGILQLLLGVIVPDLVAFLIAAGYFAWYNRNIFDYEYHLLNLQFNTTLIILFNLYYYIRYLLEERSHLQHLHSAIPATTASEPKSRDTFIARTLTRNFPVPVAEIACFYRVGTAVYLRLFSGQEHLLALSLETIERQLPKGEFFRVSRQVIVRYEAVVAYDDAGGGKLGLSLNPPFDGEVTVSKLSAKSFKDWMQNRS